MRTRTKSIIALIVVIALCTSAVAVVYAQPPLPHAFYGTLKDAAGKEVPAGAVVVAVVDDIERGRITTTEVGKYGSAEPGEPKLIVQASIEYPIENGSKIILFVNGTEADENATFKSGEVTQLNLTVPRLEDIVTYGQISSATGTGIVTFSTDYGIIEDLSAVSAATLPAEGKPNLAFPHGLFSFNITKIEHGSTVILTITFPSAVPTDAQYWKYQLRKGWYQIPFGSNDGDNTITIQLTDGGTGDGDDVKNGVIVDPGGPGIPPTPTTPTAPPVAVGGGGAAVTPLVTPTPTATPVVTPPVTPVVTPPVTPVVTPTPTPVVTPAPVVPPKIPWAFIIGIIAAVIIVVGVAYYFYTKRKA
jgi:hypothetical protein